MMFDDKEPTHAVQSCFPANAALVAQMLLPEKHFTVLDAWTDNGVIYFKIGHAGEEGIPEGAFIPEYTQVATVGATFGHATILSAMRSDNPRDGGEE